MGKKKEIQEDPVTYTIVGDLTQLGIKVRDIVLIDKVDPSKLTTYLYFNKYGPVFLEVLKSDNKTIQVQESSLEQIKKGQILTIDFLKELIINHNLKPFIYAGRD